EHKINVFLVDDPSALYLLNKMGIDSEFRHSAPIFREELRRAVRKGDTALLTTISKGFAAIEPGVLKQIDEKWFGRTINRNEQYLRYLTYAGYIVAAAVLIILCLVVWNRTLRRRILQRTEALRRSEDRIRLIIDIIPTMVWSTRPDGAVDYVNQRWLDYTGLTMEKEIKDPTGIIHPEDHQYAVKKWLVHMAAGKTYDAEMRLRRADGEYRWFLVRTAPLHDEMRNLVKWYGVATDFEDRKLAENELRLAYQRLAYHVENTPLAIIEFDKDLFIKRWSKRAEEIFGWKESEALGKNVYDPDFPVIYKEDIPQVDKINEQLMKGSVNRNLSLNRNYTKDGNIIYSEWYNSVLKDDHGNVITILSLVHNVTERKKAEEQKEFEQRDKEALINTTDDMIWSVSRDLKLIAVNKAYIRVIEALTGVTVKPGDEVLMPDVVPPEIVAFWKEAYDRALSGETFKKDTFIPAFNKSAESWRETSYHPIYKDETVVAVACYSRDITERKKAEKTLQQSYEEIRRLTEHLQKIREEERIHIAREIHDELGQQLTAVKMDVAWIDKKIPEETTDIKRKLKNMIELLDGSNQSIRRILSQLRPRILDDHGLLEAIEWLGWQFSETTGILVKFTTPEKDFKVTEEIVTCLFRVTQEAFTNITRYALSKNVSISISITEENIILIIEDNGIGFDTATVQTKKSFGILGMKERVLSLGGKFELVSSEGKGTKITVSLPYST
ncbi:MAG: domain S-box-containing protein, partial [Segetibacter sp.]|nr:domain S-box-containing protein [Segetibacter sp.]